MGRPSVVVATLVGVVVLGALFLAGLAAKERDDRFCVACHLHEEKFQRLTAPRPTDLAGGHRTKNVAVRCIDCHGGNGLGMRLVVWGMAAYDTGRFLIGRYREPSALRLPAAIACAQCHTPILKRTPTQRPGAAETFELEAQTEGRGSAAYHTIREHETVRLPCARCHSVHTTDSDAGRHFISPTRVAVCRECHRAM